MALLPGMFVVRCCGQGKRIERRRSISLHRRPCVRRDPYAEAFRFWAVEVDTFGNNQQRWLWVPAFAGTTGGSVVARTTRDPLPPASGRGEALHRRRGHAAIDHDGLPGHE